ncbi:MAG: nicotinate phosphoribosyltransferase [Deltaproteobacteria bacterium CG1_02_45_11]|nr:MAG: nicotinate phosphoribosyltransferase [Deltaproteobacteria bacterium CG1_02_45_11]
MTDLYELTMAASYYAEDLNAPATFSLFIRNYPPNRSYFVAAGLEDVINYAMSLRFTEQDLEYLDQSGLFPKAFFRRLEKFSFSGRIHAMPEGSLFFPNEPIIEVTAPLMEAQILETYLINTIGFQTMIATKAARCVQAAGGRNLVDFSFRRTHGIDAALKVARSSYLAGFAATSNVLAGKIFQIPLSGTMAHSYVSAFPSEIAAFRAFAKVFPDNAVFLIDTFDNLQGARNAAQVAKEMAARGEHLRGVRLDSGDMAAISKDVRAILDAEGLPETKIFASSGFDEYKIADVIEKGARIDAFGVGTKLGVSADAPYLDIVYKIVKSSGRDVRKLSPGKITLAGEKQVFRKTDHNGYYLEDIIGLRYEIIDTGKPLLKKVMDNGKPMRPPPSLEELRNSFRENFALLDNKYKSLRATIVYPVTLSNRLLQLQS